MLAGEGTYATQVGVYTLNCTRADNVATLTFENTLAATPEPQATPDGTAPEEEGVNCRLAGFARVELEPGQETGFQVELCPEILSLFQEPQRLVALVGGVDGCQVNQ